MARDSHFDHIPDDPIEQALNNARTGQDSRADLVRTFDISTPQASVDLAAFQLAYPGVLQYDVRAKRYVFTGIKYKEREHPAKRLAGLS